MFLGPYKLKAPGVPFFRGKKSIFHRQIPAAGTSLKDLYPAGLT